MFGEDGCDWWWFRILVWYGDIGTAWPRFQRLCDGGERTMIIGRVEEEIIKGMSEGCVNLVDVVDLSGFSTNFSHIKITPPDNTTPHPLPPLAKSPTPHTPPPPYPLPNELCVSTIMDPGALWGPWDGTKYNYHIPNRNYNDIFWF